MTWSIAMMCLASARPRCATPRKRLAIGDSKPPLRKKLEETKGGKEKEP